MKLSLSKALLATALLTPFAAPHAQAAYNGEYTETTLETTDGTTTQTTDSMAVTTTPAPASTALQTAPQTVRVKLPDGTTATIENTYDTPWYKDARVGGSRSFSFDPLTGAYVIYAGDTFSSRWDENGNPVAKPVTRPVVKHVAKKVAAPVEEPVATESVTEPMTEASTTTPEVSTTLAPATLTEVTSTTTTITQTTSTTTVSGTY